MCRRSPPSRSSRVFRQAVENGGQVKGIRAPGCGGYSRKQLDELNLIAQAGGAKAAATLAVEEGGARGSIAKFFEPEQIAALVERLEGQPGDLLVFVADRPDTVAGGAG